MHPPTMPRTNTTSVVPLALDISQALVPPRNAAYTSAIAPMNTVETTSFQVSPIAHTSLREAVTVRIAPRRRRVQGQRSRLRSHSAPGRGDRGSHACGPGSRAYGLGVRERQIALVLLGSVQAEDRVQTVEQPAEVSEVGGVRLRVADVIEELPEPPGLMGDLGMRPAHRGGGVATAQKPVHHRVELVLL